MELKAVGDCALEVEGGRSLEAARHGVALVAPGGQRAFVAQRAHDGLERIGAGRWRGERRMQCQAFGSRLENVGPASEARFAVCVDETKRPAIDQQRALRLRTGGKERRDPRIDGG